MPVGVTTSGYSRYGTTYGTTYGNSPSSSSYSRPNVGTSRKYGGTGSNYGSGSNFGTGSSNYESSSYSSLPRSASRNRPLPSGPGPLDYEGRKLSKYSISNYYKNSSLPSNSSSSIGVGIKNGPLRGDHTTGNLYSSSYTGTPLSSTRRPSITPTKDIERPSSRLSGRRSASLADITGHMSLHDNDSSRIRSRVEMSESRNGYNYDSDYSNGGLYGTTGRSSSVSRRQSLKDNDNILDMNHSSSYTKAGRSTSRDNSPCRERSSYTPLSRELRSDSPAKSISRQSTSNSSISGSGSKSSCGKVGLKNLGNTCFMSCVLQCLSNTKPLLEYCVNDNYHLDINTTTSSMKGALMKAYVNLMNSMWKNSDTFVSPNSFKTQVQKFAPRFMGYSQQDSQEFLRYLLEGLHEDVNRVTKKPKAVILQDDKLERKSDAEKAHEYWRAYLNMDNSRIVEIFVGQLKSELKFSCGHSSVTFDPFWDLSLPIPKYTQEVSVSDCLRLFMKEEELADEERPTCSKCKERKKCTKSFSIQKFPKILVLHLKRFSQERYGRKLSTSVDFPVQELDLSAYAAEPGSSKVLYNLYAVSNHSGGVHSGHYTAICKHPYSSEWNSFNDTRVSPAKSNQAISSEAYLLFFELSSQTAKL
ncbi:hypothetical protein SNE40_017343 [Patella caerulea]|uniref:Ubiquitin carboxyl-terminal hydrolase n=1 Tax=Patella caerulea TaxID=87958 RepID=A0AAN8JBV9_PATCE